MWEFLSGLIKKLDTGFLEVIILILIVAAIYYLPKLRYDGKNKRFFIFSHSYEEQKKRIRAQGDVLGKMKAQMDGFVDTQKQNLFEIRKSNLRQEILLLMHIDPKNTDTICRLYDVYHKEVSVGGFGANSWMSAIFDSWKKEYMKNEA